MRVLLIRPYLLLLPEEPYIPSEHLALEYLAAPIREHHEVSIYDAVIGDGNPNIKYQTFVDQSGTKFMHCGVSLETLRRKIETSEPEAVGITAPFYSQAQVVREVCRTVKDVDPGITTIVGGSYPSSFKDKFLESNPDADIIVIGEGEITFTELINSRLRNLKEIRGIAFREGTRIVHTTPRSTIDNLDSIEFPARDKVPYRSYAACERLFFRKSRLLNSIANLPHLVTLHDKVTNFFKPRRKNLRIPTAHIVTSRGCPMNCVFCVIHNVWGHKIRMRSPENVVDEIRFLIKQYGIRGFEFLDDNFNFSKERVIEICKKLEPLNITWRPISGVFIPSLDREVIAWMKRSGCNYIILPIESGNPNTLKNIICKNIELDHVKEILRICRDMRIKTEAYFILGLPGETKRDMIDTIKFAVNNEIDVPRLFIAVPFPGSRMYEECVKKGYIAEYYDLSRLQVSSTKTNIRTAVIKTKEFSPEEVIKLRTIGYKMIKERNFEKYEDELLSV